MTKYFNESDINEFRECFYFYAQNKIITDVSELTIIMRSLGFSPTMEELDEYFKSKDGRIDFATFLDVMHTHSQREKCEQDVLGAFVAHDPQGRGVVAVPELVHMLANTGEKLSRAEVEQLLNEVGANPRGSVKGEDVLKTMLTPRPDY